MKRANTFDRLPKVSYLYVVAALLALASCGGGDSGSQPSPPSPPEVTSVTVSPATIPIQTGASQLFTAQVDGTGAFNPGVTWSVKGVTGGNSTYGTITTSGEYTAPAAVPPQNAFLIGATSVEDSSVFGTSSVGIYGSPMLTSITPSSASAGEVLTVDATFNSNVIETPQMVFSGLSGTSITMQMDTGNGLTVTVPFGATSGPVYMSIPPQPGSGMPVLTSNSVPFTRLPNLLVHAPNKDLSSGETLQLDWRLLGASTPNVVTWTADSGSVSAQGLFQASVVSSESYSRVTGCLQNTNSCNTVLLRILPFRVGPSNPVVNVGNAIQLDAIQGESSLSPQWSVLGGGGSVASGGLFTAPTAAAQAGPVPIGATAGSTTELTSVAVSGAYPGMVNRVFDYADFTTYTPPEATFITSVAVSGNRAYALTQGATFQLIPSYEAIDVYDISNPDQPVWIDAGESATNNFPFDLFVYGNTLLSMDSSYLGVYSLASQVPALTALLPISPWQWTMNNGVLYVLPNINPNVVLTTNPIDLYDVSTGTPVHTHYDLPNPTSGTVGQLWGISGNANIVYVLGSIDINNTPTFTIATYDVSQSPPSLLSTVVSTSSQEYNLHVVGTLLFADSQIYDISNVTPVLITTLPLPLEYVWGVQGDNVLATVGSVLIGPPGFAVIDISAPTNPVVRANVTDLLSWDVFSPGTATWATNGRFYVADATGGFGVYNALPNGGPATITAESSFAYIYDQVIEQQTLYAAAVYGSGAGGLACFDVSGSTPNLLGTLMYTNDSSFALQVSGTTVFLGLADSLKIVDASNPESPVEIGSVIIPVNALALSGNTLFVGTGDGRLVVFDVSTPASPTQIASVTMPLPSTMRLSGTLLLVAAAQSGLLVFDVSNPSAPAMLSQFSPSISAPVWDVVQVGGSAVMLAADSSGIVTVDISNPSNPKQLYQQPLPYATAFPNKMAQTGILPAFSLAAQNGLTYVGTTAAVTFAFDATVPAVPRLMALNVVGNVDYTVSKITPNASSLLLAVQGMVVKMDNSIPQNSIDLYYPPAALTYIYPPGDVAKRDGITGNPKLEWMSRRSPANTHTVNRFGVVQHGTPQLTEINSGHPDLGVQR
jgi:hypothetical protein